jgi:hypothetical protein
MSKWKQSWTEEEDKRLVRGIEEFGESNWKKISEIVETREPGETQFYFQNDFLMIA